MKKVLIANRGEIAVRVIRACHDLGIQTVAVYSEADKDALHVLHADEAVCIGPPQAGKSYLNIPSILTACQVTGADGIHPGYGFLAENANFASLCEKCGVTFIGPTSRVISMLGDKAQAKAIAKKAGCPVIPGSEGVVADDVDGSSIGFPLFIKASAGGGGRGIRVVHKPQEFASQFAAAKKEALAAFGNGDLYLEKMIQNPRHIEVQVLADQYGNIVHLGERDCSIQRRRQKLIEESPSPYLTPRLRRKIGKAAVKVVKAAGYTSAGTVEFLVDKDHNFYFMEVNTRIQVEHTVTEEYTGIDIVKEQIRVALGEKLPYRQRSIPFSGHVMEFRVNAEDPKKNFMPHAGRLNYYLPPGGPHIRVDSACYSGYTIPPYYDPMIAKLIVKGKDRKEVLTHANRALKEFHIGGIETTLPFHQQMIQDPRFIGGEYDIHYVDEEFTFQS